MVESAPLADLLLFATHARINRLYPSRSAIVLSGASLAEDLTVEQISKLRLDRQSVVLLSACEAGWIADSGVGSVSLVRPFLRAGAGAVIASVPPIADSTAPRVFGALLRRIAQGVVPSKAYGELFQTSPLEMRTISIFAPLSL